MKEILLACGFIYEGVCHKCGGGDKYVKMIGGKPARIKANEQSGIFTLTYQGSVTKGRKAMMETILERNGITSKSL